MSNSGVFSRASSCMFHNDSLLRRDRRQRLVGFACLSSLLQFLAWSEVSGSLLPPSVGLLKCPLNFMTFYCLGYLSHKMRRLGQLQSLQMCNVWLKWIDSRVFIRSKALVWKCLEEAVLHTALINPQQTLVHFILRSRAIHFTKDLHAVFWARSGFVPPKPERIVKCKLRLSDYSNLYQLVT